jgi:hypothetical protein
MKKLIFLTIGLGIVLGIIIGVNLVNRCASAQSNFPMCVTIYKYLVWPPEDFQSNAIPIASSTQGYLMKSGFEIYNKSALKFPAVNINENDPNLQIEGLMYYKKSDNKWRCSVKTSSGDIQWQDCGGGGGPWPNNLTAPVTIWRDANKTFKVLEISE